MFILFEEIIVKILYIHRKFSEVILAVWVLLLFTSYISNYTAQKVFHATVDKDITPANVVDIVSQKDVKIGWLARGPVERFFRVISV